ncbi:MAG: fused MFS/spermidine synthase [Planctomycetaceae bacterium]
MAADEKPASHAKPASAGDPGHPVDAPPSHLPPRGELPPPVSEARESHQTARGRASDFWALAGCNAIVFGASVCIMVLELTASRLIAAYLGSSLYTWTSVIGVVLAGISIGNYLGGWLADRFAPQKLLGWLFLAAGVSTFGVLFLNSWAAAAVRPQGLHWQWWVMLVVAWVFLLPAIALGTISPVTASMALKRSSRTGITVGNIYAWGAVGSIVGTFLAGFWLIGELGTRQIVVLTSTALVLMGALVAGGQRALRVALLLGVLQFVVLLGLCAAITAESMGNSCRALAGIRSGWSTNAEDFRRDDEAILDAQLKHDDKALQAARERNRWRLRRQSAEAAWGEWGERLGTGLHDLGLTLALRRDAFDEYFDESDYYTISIVESTEQQDQVKQLRLDFLIHSYYNAERPTKLYYDYERVYAALTERAAERWQRRTTVPLGHPPVEFLARIVPEGVVWNAAQEQLAIDGAMNVAQLRQLLAVGVDAEFREALLTMWENAESGATSSKGDGGAITHLPAFPPGISFPDELASRVRYDPALESLVCTAPFSLDQALDVMSQGRDASYVAAVVDLWRRSRRISTLFIGGGGFVFPRWIEARFPDEPRIDVAEIDPAVLAAVENELGLPRQFGPPREGKTWVNTHLGDARQFVDEQLRENARRAAQGHPPVFYDCIYGDAFNDLSVPWHLTTAEFTTGVRDLLTPGEGLFLVNIIDIYPRAQFPSPDDKRGRAQVEFAGEIPRELLPADLPENEWRTARGPDQKLEIARRGNTYVLRYTGVMSSAARNALENVGPATGATAPQGESFANAVLRLFLETTARNWVEMPPPDTLFPDELSSFVWTPAQGEFRQLQAYQAGAEGYMYGFRGVMSAELRDRLLAAGGENPPFAEAVRALETRSQSEPVGQFLGRYVNTARALFPYVYVFSSNEGETGDQRDTFVVACSLKALDLDNLYDAGGHWRTPPFAWTEPGADRGPLDRGDMPALLELARNLQLTDDFAPVDNLLAPVFVSRAAD